MLLSLPSKAVYCTFQTLIDFFFVPQPLQDEEQELLHPWSNLPGAHWFSPLVEASSRQHMQPLTTTP